MQDHPQRLLAASRLAAKKKIGERKAREDKFPAPTEEPVDLVEMHRILNFDPKHGSGDVASGIGFGFRTRKIRHKAKQVARKLLPNFRGHADDQDAVRHALLNFMLTREIGAKSAKIISDGHERFPLDVHSGRGYGHGSGRGHRSGDPGPAGDVLQDVYNNFVGRQAAQDPRNKGKTPDQVVMELYRAGKLQTRPFRIKGQELKK